jgi:methanogenic corrinoid protein MtbC1
MTGTITEDARESYLAAVGRADRQTALAVVHELLDARADPVDILVDLVAATQVVVGARWQRALCTVADEHAATAIGEAAIASVGAAIPEPVRPAGRALIACPEREWHALPARVVTESLRHYGWPTVLLGASTPAPHLADYLRHHRVTLVVLSCSVPGALLSARRIIEAATRVGVPVVTGGRAFGSDPSRAATLGATAWAASPGALGDLLDHLPAAPDALPALPRDNQADVAELSLRMPELTAGCTRIWCSALSADGHSPLGTEHDVGQLAEQALHSLMAAILTDDFTVVSDFRTWLVLLLTAYGYPPKVAALLLDALRDSVQNLLVAGPKLLDAALRRD